MPEVWTPLKAPVVSLNKKLYPHCSILVGLGTYLSLIYISKIYWYHNQTLYDWVTVFYNLLILWQSCLYRYTIFLFVFRKKSWACFTPLSNWFWLAIICSQCIIWLLNLLNESSSYSIHHMLNNRQWHHGLFKYQHVYIAVFALYSVVKFWLHSALLMFPAFIVQYSEL